ncbi:MAG TPA: arylesterase [Beijerinckiaceae bacterium]|nr:arylesterase [Beijerinckiaceae bacterium]
MKFMRCLFRSPASNRFATTARSYGDGIGLFHFAKALIRSALLVASCLLPIVAYAAPAADPTIHIVAFGDSLTAGYQLPQDSAFPVVMEKALRADGFAVAITNAGISGDTASDGLDRLDWSVPDGTDAIILELGANDMLRGLDPALTKQALASILGKLKARRIPVLLAGMLAAPQLGQDYASRFNAIYPDLAKAYDVPLYPFFLAGMAGVADLTQSDGMHPTREGVEAIVKTMLPTVEAFLKRLRPPS